jgi:hypothetical protein
MDIDIEKFEVVDKVVCINDFGVEDALKKVISILFLMCSLIVYLF